MENSQLERYTAFQGQKCVASGELTEVVRRAKAVVDEVEHASVLIFDDATSRQVEINFRGTLDDVLERLTTKANDSASQEADAQEPRVGRPKLGVVAREVTLLPRHWEWLATQPGGASVTLRKLVEEARRTSVDKDKERVAREAAHRFMMIMAGNFPGFEEATRALDRKDKEKFEQCIAEWPVDIRNHVSRLADGAGWEP